MKSKHISIFMTMMIILLLVLSACQSAAPAAEEAAEEPAAAEAATAVEADEEAAAEEPAEEITITFWKPSWGIDEEYLAPVFEEFEAAHPGVKVEFLFHPWEGLLERYTTAFMGDEPPDVFYLPDLHYPKLAAAGYLAKLDEDFPDDIATLKDNYLEQWWEPGIYDGNVYGLPYVHVGITIVYNKDIFDAAGLPYPPGVDDPDLDEWTWDKFVEVSQQLTDADNGKYGFGWAANWSGDREIWEYCYLAQAGDRVTNEDGTAVGFDNEAGLTAFNFMNDMANTYKIVPDNGMNAKFQDMFINGDIAMAGFDVYQVIGLVKDHPELNIGITPYPQGPGTDLLDGRGMHANVGYLYLSGKSKNPEMAFELMKFMNEKDQVEDYINAVGLFGCRKDYEMKIEPPEAEELGVQILEIANRNGFANLIDPKQIEIREIFTAEVENMILQVKTPEEAWKDAVEKINSALSE